MQMLILQGPHGAGRSERSVAGRAGGGTLFGRMSSHLSAVPRTHGRRRAGARLCGHLLFHVSSRYQDDRIDKFRMV